MIEITDLHKQFGDLAAVRGVSLVAKPGEIFGLLGPNGAGKSTTIGCICGLLPPTSGRIAVLGHDVVTQGPASRRELGVVPQELALYEDLSARENLDFFAAAYGLRGTARQDRVREVLAAIGLLDRAREPVKRFSGGMKRRLNFGCGIVHRPKVLLLDEPTVGVDPQSRVHLVEMVREQVRQGTCVLYTTHYMEEAEALCARLAIVDGGRIIAQGTLAELRAQVGGRDVLRLTGHFVPDTVRSALRALTWLEVLQAEPEALRLSVDGASRRLPEVFAALQATGAIVRETTMTPANLESLFIKLTGKELRE